MLCIKLVLFSCVYLFLVFSDEPLPLCPIVHVSLVLQRATEMQLSFLFFVSFDVFFPTVYLGSYVIVSVPRNVPHRTNFIAISAKLVILTCLILSLELMLDVSSPCMFLHCSVTVCTHPLLPLLCNPLS